jgi:hypothetical protein
MHPVVVVGAVLLSVVLIGLVGWLISATFGRLLGRTYFNGQAESEQQVLARPALGSTSPMDSEPQPAVDEDRFYKE